MKIITLEATEGWQYWRCWSNILLRTQSIRAMRSKTKRVQGLHACRGTFHSNMAITSRNLRSSCFMKGGTSVHHSDASPSLSNYILATFVSHPNFMYLPGRHVYSCSYVKCLLGRVLIPRICNCERPPADEMSRHATMRVWSVVCISGPTCQILLFLLGYRVVPLMT